MLSQDLRKRSQNKLLNKQLSSITNTLTQAAQRRELEIMKKSGPKGINGTPAGGVLRGGDGKVPQPDRATQNKRKEAVDLHLPIQQSSSLKALVEHHEVAGLSMVANGQTTNLDDVVDDRPIDLDALFARLTSGKPNVGQGASTNGSELGDNRTTSFTLTHGDDAVKAPSSPSTSDDATTLQEMLADIERLRRSEAKEMSVSLNDLALTQKPVGLDGTRHSTVASTLDESNVLDELRARVAKMSIAKPLEPLATNTGPQFQIFNGVTNDIPDHVALGSGSMATVDAAPSYEETELQCGPVDTTHGSIDNQVLPEPDGYKALQEKQAYIESEEAKLNKIIEEVSAEEAKYHTTVDKKQLLNHIIVTNIAADAGEEELQCVFSYYQLYIHGITILKKKHPQNGTRAAYIDFYDRMSAWNASRVIDSIFGLKLRVRLAVDVDIPEKNMLLLHAASQEKKRKEAASGVDRADRDGGWF